MAQQYKYDFDCITIAEYRSLFKQSQSEDDGDSIVSRVTGVPVAEIRAMSQLQWRKFMKKFFSAANAPLVDENLASGSTSTSEG